MPSAKLCKVMPTVWLLHSLAHIELNALELCYDTLLRAIKVNESLPFQFYLDFISIAADEARHFDLLCERLQEFQSYYGQIPAHNNLWTIATKTQNDLLGRIASIQLGMYTAYCHLLN